jgi:sugar phosphate isomerase/epimerase
MESGGRQDAPSCAEQGVPRVFVAATTGCFPGLSLTEALERLVDLEFVNIEIDISESSDQIKPSWVTQNLSAAIDMCNATNRLTVVSYRLDIEGSNAEYLEQFEACCKLAKATKVVILTVPSSPLGMPFNEEVERFKALVRIADSQGVRVGMHSQSGRIAEDPDTVMVMCQHVSGLGLTLDPSHYIYRRNTPAKLDRILRFVQHVYLRDTTKESLQVRVGQGLIEYGRLISQLEKVDYTRALCVSIQPQPDVDHSGEMRKLRLLLESLLG